MIIKMHSIKMLPVICILFVLQPTGAQLFGIRNCPAGVETFANFDINQYLGKWYEVERYYPLWFEFGLKCGVAEYSLKENGKIRVTNTGTNRLTGVRAPTIGEAKILNTDDASKLYVTFSDEGTDDFDDQLFFRNGNYWVLDVDYAKFAIVYSCTSFPGLGRTDIVWILGRTPTLEQDILDRIYELLEGYGIRTKYLKPVEQNCGA